MSVPVSSGHKNKKSHIKAETPAFFFGLSQKKEFHGMEILRAASKAVGIEPYEITNHANYLQFHIEKDKFPNLDELMLWLYHLTCRKIQYQCLENNIQQISMYLLDHPCPLRELEIIKGEFELLFRKEKECAAAWDDKPQNRDSLSRITNWSEYFHTGLLKEYAFAEDQMLVQGVSSKIGDKYSRFWYYPFTERPGWTAWAVVVEIALRKMVSTWQGCFNHWKENTNLLETIPSVTPVLSYSWGNKFKTHNLLEIKLRGVDSVKFSSKTSGAFRNKCIWYLYQEALPWNKGDYRNMPGAKTIWIWAAKKDGESISIKDTEKLDQYFGDKYEK